MANVVRASSPLPSSREAGATAIAIRELSLPLPREGGAAVVDRALPSLAAMLFLSGERGEASAKKWLKVNNPWAFLPLFFEKGTP